MELQQDEEMTLDLIFTTFGKEAANEYHPRWQRNVHFLNASFLYTHDSI